MTKLDHFKTKIEAGPVELGPDVPYNTDGAIPDLVHHIDIGAVDVVFSCSVWIDIVGLSSNFKRVEPAARHDLLLSGNLGQIDGQCMWTDAYLPPDQQWIERDALFLVHKDGRIVKHKMVYKTE